MADKTVIYVAGYGRSGSTLLERILGSHPAVWGTGELANLPRLIAREHALCSCGRPIRDCPFWGQVVMAVGDGNGESWLKLQNRVESVLGLVPAWRRRRAVRTYRELTRGLLASIFSQLPPEVRYLVDSSKTARWQWLRPVALARHAGVRVKVIHLVRDGRACVWSQLRGSNRKLERREPARMALPALRTVVSWPLANLGAHLFQLRHPGNYLRVRYEDLVTHPAATLKRLGEFLGIGLEGQIDMVIAGNDIPLGHQISGNRLRSQRKLVLRLDDEWKRKLGRGRRVLFWATCWPLALLYGYRPWGGAVRVSLWGQGLPGDARGDAAGVMATELSGWWRGGPAALWRRW